MDSEDNFSRPALKELNSNETTNVSLSGSNQKQLVVRATTPNKQVSAASPVVGLNRSTESLSENFCNNFEKRNIDFADRNKTSLDSIDLLFESLKPFNFIGQSESSLQDSLVSSLAENLGSTLSISKPDEFSRSKSLSVPLESESSGSHLSSDNETYVECRSFSPSEDSNRFTSALDLVSIADSSHGWEDLVTSVTGMEMDSLENTNEQLDAQLDLTPTAPSNTDVLNLAEAQIEQSVVIPREELVSNSEHMQNENEENAHINLTSCMLPEAVANLIENVDANSFDNTNNDLEKCLELQIVPTTVADLDHSAESNRTISESDGDYFHNVTLEDHQALASQNKSVCLADITQDSKSNSNTELSFATVEQTVENLTTESISPQKVTNETQEMIRFSMPHVVENEENSNSNNQLNLTQEQVVGSDISKNDDVDNEEGLHTSVCSEILLVKEVSPSTTSSNKSLEHLDEIPTSVNENAAEFNADQPLPDIPTEKLSLNIQFPVKSVRNQYSFPESPKLTKHSVSGFSNKSQSPCETNESENYRFNETIDVSKINPNEIETEVNGVISPSQTFNQKHRSPAPNMNETKVMDSSFNTKQETPNAIQSKTNTIFDQTFDSRQKASNETITFEPMDVDTTVSSPNGTFSYQPDTLTTTKSSESLSEKEKSDTNNEKDVFVENFASNNQQDVDDMFKNPNCLGLSGQNVNQPAYIAADEEFQSNRIFLNPSDFDYLLNKGNGNSVEGDRSSLLLRFDPLLGHSVPVNLPVKASSSAVSASALSTASPSPWSSDIQLQQQEYNSRNRLSPANEEEEHFYDSNRSFNLENGLTQPKPEEQQPAIEEQKQKPIQTTARSIKKNVKMSVDVMQDMKIENDSKSIEEIDTQTEKKQNFKMDELEKKIKNEVLKTEDIEKKLKEAEQREEALIKRITEKDKAINKMNGVIEAYEKAIAELISEKEHILQNYEKQLAEVKADRDSNYHHLTSLETTFSDLHVKYEKSKEMTVQLKNSEEALLAEKRQNLENLRLQEQRYEKMKNHAMQQLEIANKKLESLTKNHAMETTKLKALLKKEEISRASMTEQLQQKTRENEELVKICDELINGQGS